MFGGLLNHWKSWLLPVLLLSAAPGCFAPLRSPGIPASALPEEFRVPVKSLGVPLNYAMLSMPVPAEYVLGRDDVVKVEISDLIPSVQRLPRVDGGARKEQPVLSYAVEVRVTGSGDILLPLVGAVRVGGLTLADAQAAVTRAYGNGFIDEPRIAVSLVAKSTTSVMVLGEVGRPDAYELPKYQNDVAHALSRAGGLGPDAGNVIEVHRMVAAEDVPPPAAAHPNTGPLPAADVLAARGTAPHILRIPLRWPHPVVLRPEQVTLQAGDVVVVPNRSHEVFFVVGKLSSTNFVRFSLGRENRDLGTGFVLPRDRDVDVVTAVAMAGYIDPIDSPTTVTVQRTLPGGEPMLIHVDLIAARFDRRENVMVKAGDIIYLNPDAQWWMRRTFDRILPSLFEIPYERMIFDAFGHR